MAAEFRSKTGVIPDDYFENEPGPPRDPAKAMSAKALAEFDAHTARIAAEGKKSSGSRT